MRSLPTVFKWAGRATALLFLLFWGAFFVEHLSEWFLRRDGNYPPPFVWIAQLLHFSMLVGLGLMLRWEKLGTAILAAGTVAFFASIGVRSFPKIALVNLVPMACFAIYWTTLALRPR
ncbi:MAG TPA: hypothetical protein VN442_19225 [Bryobacteraceae bacterium]|nr:hypothetical protein [Bryobacteraceae bacterium]